MGQAASFMMTAIEGGAPGGSWPPPRVASDPVWIPQLHTSAPASRHRLLQRLVAAENISPHTTDLKRAEEEALAWLKLLSDVVECSLDGEFGRDDPHRSLDLYRCPEAVDRRGDGVVVAARLKIKRD